MLMILSQESSANTTLRFQPQVDDKATRLGDVIIISADRHHWANLALDSHPNPGDLITKEMIMRWMELKLGPITHKWLGKTKIRVKKTNETPIEWLYQNSCGFPGNSGPRPSLHKIRRLGLGPTIEQTTAIPVEPNQLWVDKAKMALLEKLKSRYTRVTVTPLSELNTNDYSIDDFNADVSIHFPVAKRVCVWMKHKKSDLRIPVWFRIQANANVWIAKRELRQNTLISNDSFVRKSRNIAGLNTSPATQIPSKIWLTSSIKQGHILLKNQLKEPPLITRGQHLKTTVHNQHINILIDTIAQTDGYLGETIRVENSLTHQNLHAKINGVNQAELVL